MQEIFVGRAEQLATLESVAAKVSTGEPWVVVVHGEAGLGKSALLRRFASSLDGFSFLTASADQQEADLPAAVLEQLLARVDPQVRARFPLLAPYVQTASPFAVGGQMIALLGDLATHDPLVLMIDDGQWLDDFSFRVLMFVQRRLWADKIMMVTAQRSTEGQHQSKMRSFARGFERGLEMRLEALDQSETSALADTLLGAGLEMGEVRRLHELTGGHTLYLRTLLEDMPAQRLDRLGKARAFSRSLAVLIHDILTLLPADSRALAEALATLGTRAPLHVPAKVAGLTDAEAEQALEPLLSSWLVQWWPEEPSTPVAIRHDLQRAAIYAQLNPTRRHQLHVAAADAEQGNSVWRHRVAAAAGFPDAGLSQQLELVAVKARDSGLYAAAATHLLWAADLSETQPERERRVLTAFFDMARADQNIRLGSLRDAVEACQPGVLRDLAVTIMDSTAGRAKALHSAHRAWAALREHPEPQRMAPFAGYTLPAVFLIWSDPGAAIEVCRWALPLGLHGERLSGTRAVLAWATMVLEGAGQALAAVEAMPADAADTDVSNVQLTAVRGSLEVLSGRLFQGTKTLRFALRQVREGAPIALGRRLRVFARWANYAQGRWNEVIPPMEELAWDTESIAWFDDPMENLSWIWVHAAQGDWVRSGKRLGNIRQATGDHFEAVEHICSAIGRGIIAQARADYQEMYDALAPHRDHPPTSYDHAQMAPWWLPLLAEAEIGTQRYSAASDTLARFAESTGGPYLAMQMARLRGWLAERQGDQDAALDLYRTAAETPGSPDDAVFQRAMLNLWYGRLLRSVGQRRNATKVLQTAHGVFSTLGATPYLQQCAQELAQCGLHLSRQTSQYTTELTDREREIAHLAGLGKTNREISTELFVTPKTIEYHLSNIYLKLGIRGRQQLRELLRRSAATPIV